MSIVNDELSGLLTDDEYTEKVPTECKDCDITYSECEASDTADNSNPDGDCSIFSTKNKWALKGRLKSWALWLSILGALGVILEATGVFEKIGLDSTAFDVLVNAIGSVLVAFGILNNPTDTEAF